MAVRVPMIACASVCVSCVLMCISLSFLNMGPCLSISCCSTWCAIFFASSSSCFFCLSVSFSSLSSVVLCFLAVSITYMSSVSVSVVMCMVSVSSSDLWVLS